MIAWDTYQCEDGECAWEGDYLELDRKACVRPDEPGDEMGAYACPACGGSVKKMDSSEF